jgi:hypothetical protein
VVRTNAVASVAKQNVSMTANGSGASICRSNHASASAEGCPPSSVRRYSHTKTLQPFDAAFEAMIFEVEPLADAQGRSEP